MKNTPWDDFYKKKLTQIFADHDKIIDIGGGLGIAKGKCNRIKKENEWLLPLAADKEYLTLDPVPDYKPDIVADIHSLPFQDNSQEAYICWSVLEHVENPLLAVNEIYRTLKPGGSCLIAVPFILYYHAMKPYYNDYWRFTSDGVRLLAKDFRHIEIQNIYGPLEAWTNLLPIPKKIKKIAYYLDVLFKKTNSEQTGGFYAYLKK